MPPNQMQAPVSPQDVPNQSQDPVPQAGPTPHDLTQDQSAAALGFITTLSQNHLQQKQAAEQAVQDQQNAPQETPQAPTTPEPPKEEGSILKEIQALRKEVQGNDVQKEIADIRKELETLLKDDGKASEN